MMKKSELSKPGRFKRKRVKVILGGTVAIAIVALVGFVAFATSTSKQESKTLEQATEDTSTSQEQVKIEMNLPVAQSVAVESKQNNNSNTTNESSNNQSITQTNTTSNSNSTTKKQNTQVNQVSTKPITYTSKTLGISFDMPASWTNKYTIKDDGKEILVYMKRQSVATGDGLLFVITSDVTDYDNGSYLDSVAGVSKITVIKGKQYLVGTSTDCRVDVGDPDLGTYKTMSSQVSQVLKTLR